MTDDVQYVAGHKPEQIASLAERASLCVACGLARTRTRVVFGDGNPEAPLMLIGEGPGQQEDLTGVPFVGRAGELLNACLKENGISRKHIYITNTVRCRPTVMEGGVSRNRPPTSDEIRACSTWLQQTIQTIEPLVIVCLGAPAANTIIHRNFKMTQERGKWFETPFARAVLATWHPAFVLRLHGEEYDTARAALVGDLEAARLRVIEERRKPPATLF